MIILDRDYNTRKVKKMGTVRIVDGKLEFKIPNKQYEELIIGGAPLDKITPAHFMNYTVGRFALSTCVVLKLEDADDVWHKEKPIAKKKNAKRRDFMIFWRSLKAILTKAPSTNTVFNQYRDRNKDFDVPRAATIRIENLRRYMAEATKTASILVVGEAAGPWGCRFSGVPFTGEKQLLDPSFPLHGECSSKTKPARPTKYAPPFISESAKTFWGVMLPYYGRFLVWDAFPLHPCNPRDALTVRNPSKSEVAQFGEALRLIKAYMKPTHIVAVGKKAFEELSSLGEASIYVRHPSRGGKEKFTSGIQDIFYDEKKKF